MSRVWSLAYSAKGGPYICQAPEATPSRVIPVMIMISVHQYPSFVYVTVLLRVPLNLSAIPVNLNGSTRKKSVEITTWER
jgi:hypothetical protein